MRKKRLNMAAARTKNYFAHFTIREIRKILFAVAFLCLQVPAAYAQSQCNPGPRDCPTVGSACIDGTVFIGCAPTVYKRLYVTRCDAGQSWNGSGCTGTRTAFYWSNSNAAESSLRDPGIYNIHDGQANTAALTNGVADGTGDSRTTAGVQAHNAAKYCADLVESGYDDWYLPAFVELVTFDMVKNLGVLNNTTTPNIYHSSSGIYGSSSVMIIDYTSGYYSYGSKIVATGYNIRCMRHD